MKKNRIIGTMGIAGAAMMVLWGAGCETIAQQRRRQEMYEQEDKRLVQESMRRIEGRVETLEFELERIQQELGRTQDAAAASARAATESLEPRMGRMESRMAALEKQREQDRQELVDSLSKKMADIMKTSSSAGRSAKRSGYGYEHTVEAGQTLSEIAAAYGVSVQRILEENNLKNANLLKVGQVLFIPE
ncbi:MAG TPA: LysM domain-containing protein [Kiritimatiellia bacterium]|nr:LysM domain-containing protein [Kiritimatiellia bacterium]